MAYADKNNSEFVLNVYNYFRISEINLSIDFSENPNCKLIYNL